MALSTIDPTADVPPTPDVGHEGVHRVLVVADERFRGADFMAELRSHMLVRSAEVEVYVVAPALARNVLEHEMATIDLAIGGAQERLDDILNELEGQGIHAIGQIGDTDPVVAVGDGLRQFPADELVMISHVDSQRSYAERDLWSRLREDFRLPISDMLVARPAPGEGPPRALRVVREPAKEQTTDEMIRATRNFPPLDRRDAAGMVVGLLGTFFLGLIAVAANSDAEGPITGGGAAIILIAIASFLLNGAHAVGLLFFQAIHYKGIWERFMSRTSLAFTAVGLVVALFLWLA